MNIGELRGNFPMYDDLSDEALLQGVHSKFYADMDFSEFMSKLAERRATQTAEDIPQVDAAGNVSFGEGGTGGEYAAPPPQPRVDVGGMASAVGSGGNRGLAALADLPFDVLNMLGNALGAPTLTATPTELVDFVSEKLTGTKPIEALTTPTGSVDTAPEKFIGRVAEEVTAGTGMAGAVSKLAKSAKYTNAGSYLGRVKNDPAFMAREAQAAMGGGTGAAIAEHVAPGSVGAEITGSVLGGATPGIGLMPDPVKAPFREAKTQFMEPFTDEGAVRRVSAVLTEQTANPEEAARNIRANAALLREVAGDVDVPTIRLAQDEGLTRAVRALSVNDPKLLGIISRADREINEKLIANLNRQLAATVTPEHAVETARSTITGITRRLEDIITLAKDKADLIARNTQSGTPPEQLSQSFYDALSGGYKSARAIERKVWKRIDRDEVIDLAPLQRDINKFAARTENRPIDKATIPSEQFAASKKLQGENAGGTMQGLMDYRSNILQSKREAFAAGNGQKAQILTELEHKVAEFIDSAGTSPQYRAAAEYTRTMHSNFTKGKLGRILGFDVTGAERVDPEAALQAIIQPKGAGAARGDDVVQLSKGVPYKFPSTPGLVDPVETALKDKFADANTPRMRENFLKNFGPILRKFPGLNKNLRALDVEIDAVAERIAQLEGRKATVLDKKRVSVAALLDTDPDRLGATLSRMSRTELAAVNKFMRREGVETGLQHAVLKDFYRKMENGGALRPNALSELLKEPGGYLPYQEILTEAQRANLKAVDKAITVMQEVTASGSPSIGKALESSILVSLAAKALSSRAGTYFASGQNALIVAGATARAGKNFVDTLPAGKAKALLERALLDGDLMADLLSPTKAKSPSEYVAVLRGHLATAGVRADDED